jgi:hypothetical protein
MHRMVLANTLLELLIAVPCHIVVRRRSECCAGIYTGAAICLGVGIGIIVLGRTMLLLYHHRIQRIRIPQRDQPS